MISLIAVLTLASQTSTTASVDDAVARLLRGEGDRPRCCVVLGEVQGEVVGALARRRGSLVHVLGRDAETVGAVRAYLQDNGLYGAASVELGSDLPTLPYADNLVNLVWAESPSDRVSLAEVHRVLCPGGVLLLRPGDGPQTKAELRRAGFTEVAQVPGAGPWLRAVKPRPAEMDQWTHTDHGPGRNRVSQDTLVAAPSGLRWVTSPPWQDRVACAMLAADGRLYYVRASTRVSKMTLAARDASNGLLLWRREWERGERQTPRFFTSWPTVAGDGHVFVLLGDQLVAIDGVNGRTVQTFDTADLSLDATASLAYLDGRLVLTTADELRVFGSDGPKSLWRYRGKPRDTVAGAGRVIFPDFDTKSGESASEVLVCLDLATGEPKWRFRCGAEGRVDRRGNATRSDAVTLSFVHDDLVVLTTTLTSGAMRITTLSATTGQTISEYKTPRIRADQLFLKGKLLHVPPTLVPDPATGRSAPGVAIDPRTAEVVKRLGGRYGSSTCQLPVCTPRLVFSPKMSIQALDTEKGRSQACPLATGGCLAGMIPANGLLYNALESGCQCNVASVRGLTALEHAEPVDKQQPPILERGPAYGDGSDGDSSSEEWPTFRRDIARSGRTASVPRGLIPRWRTRVVTQERVANDAIARDGNMPREPLTAPVVSGGWILVAEIDAHRVDALEAATGEHLWSFTAGGRIDSPPTLDGGFCVFGCRDGWLYCLRARDGELAWRLRLAYSPQRIVAGGQFESSWPLFGSVLVKDHVVYATAGRSTGAEGGIRVCAADAATGEVRWTQSMTVSSEGGVPAMFLNDLLVSDGEYLYLRNHQIDPETGKHRQVVRPIQLRVRGEVRVPAEVERGPTRPVYLHSGWLPSLLDGSWRYAMRAYHKGNQRRSYGDVFGQLIVFDASRTYGFRSGYWSLGRRGPAERFATAHRYPLPVPGETASASTDWTHEMPGESWVEAAALTGKTLLMAGPVDRTQRETTRGFLWEVSAADGRIMRQTTTTAPPVLDGMAVSQGRLYLSTTSGDVMCLGE